MQTVSLSLTLFFLFFPPCACPRVQVLLSFQHSYICQTCHILHPFMPGAKAKAGVTDAHLISAICWYCFLVFHKGKRENEREKEKGGTVAAFDEINGLKVPCSAVMASIRHAWQGKTGTFQTDGLKVFTALWLRVTAYLNATCWGGNCAVKETHSIYLPALIASKRLVCWGVKVHLGKRQLLKGHSWGYRGEVKAFC